MSKSKGQRRQRGGSSDFMHSFYASTAVGGPAAISRATLQGINSAPMFKPLSHGAVVPGSSTGIVPSGIYLATHVGGGCGKQHGSGRMMSALKGMSNEALRELCNQKGLSCRGQKGGYLRRDTLIKNLSK